jgi:hypothetical protein
MSKLQGLLGKPKTYTIGGIELELGPRTMNDMELLIELTKEDKRGEAMKELIKRTLKDAVPDATDEEIGKIAFEHFKALSEAIVEVNGLNAK